jgi:hypothetical protein
LDCRTDALHRALPGSVLDVIEPRPIEFLFGREELEIEVGEPLGRIVDLRHDLLRRDLDRRFGQPADAAVPGGLHVHVMDLADDHAPVCERGDGAAVETDRQWA